MRRSKRSDQVGVDVLLAVMAEQARADVEERTRLDDRWQWTQDAYAAGTITRHHISQTERYRKLALQRMICTTGEDDSDAVPLIDHAYNDDDGNPRVHTYDECGQDLLEYLAGHHQQGHDPLEAMMALIVQ